MLGVGLAFLREYVADNIFTPADVAASLDLPVLTTIPHYAQPGKMS